uniref:Endonuclease exonuclease phosphatase domain containing protein n=1 Tax=Haemonchus contortus TaxID=6289 RepID=A0A7I4YLS2_HAECO
MQARKIKYDVIGLTEMRRHRPLHAVFETGEELFLGTCDSRGVGQNRVGSVLYKSGDHAFFEVIVGDFNAKIGPRRTAEELHIEAHGMEWNE